MKLLKVKVHTTNKIEMFKKLYKVYSVLIDANLSDNELTMLSYYNVYGVSDKTDKFLFKIGVFTNQHTFKNSKAKLRKFNLLHKPKFKNDLTDHIKIPIESQLGMLIKFDNS